MKHFSDILNGGFIKLPRKLMSQPEISQLIDKEKGLGLGLYFSINLYLANCKGGWGLYTGRQFRALAAEMKTSWKVVKRVIDAYGLFIVEGDRFTSPWIQDQFAHAGKKRGSSRANILMRAEDIEKDIEKRIKKKPPCVCLTTRTWLLVRETNLPLPPLWKRRTQIAIIKTLVII